MQACRELSSLPCSPADPLRSQLAHRWSDSDQDMLHVHLVGFCRVAVGMAPGRPIFFVYRNCRCTWKPRRLGPVELAMHKRS